ncbi:MAG: hypothetical protein EAX90_14765 [Candidatus Heimdallarchaeota archaeon]|nr:hypothetical protein [Candidatus Heimdallarchaeota archaeon]
MKNSLQEIILKNIELIENIEINDKLAIENQLILILKDTLNCFSSYFNKKPILPTKEITFENIPENLGVNFGIKRLNNKIILANWILDLQIKTRGYLLSFFILKESILHFFDGEIKDVDEAIINIITILLLVEMNDITTLDNPMLSAIRSKIYSEEIASISYAYWDKLFVLLMKKNIPFIDILEEFQSIYKNKKLSKTEKVKLFSDWVIAKTISVEVVISPIYTNLKLIDLIETLLELGYEKSSTSIIAKKYKVSQKTITKRFKALNESYSTYWVSNINYEELNLHNYFFTISTTKEDVNHKLIQMLGEIPYLKTLFQGFDDNSMKLYSPALICPHIISEQLREKLRKMKNEKLISDYCIQLVREKFQYYSITNFPYNPTVETFRKLISSENEYLRKYCFYHQKRSSILPTKDKPIKLDYNLLYFLSIIIGKYLLQARYAVRINEFEKFYKENNISITDVKAQTDLLYQNEFRAKNKDLLTFSLFMRNITIYGQDILIFEIPTVEHKSQEEINEIIKKLQVFSFLGQISLYDRYIFQVPGVSHTHPIRKVIQETLNKEEIPVSFSTIKLLKSSYVPIQDLYDYNQEKWKIMDF